MKETMPKRVNIKSKTSPTEKRAPHTSQTGIKKTMWLRFLAAFLLLALSLALAFKPDQRMIRLWLNGDGIERFKLDFKINGVPTEWGYACWAGPFVEFLGNFGITGQGIVNETFRNIPPVLNHNIDGGALNINGAIFNEGIGTHAPSKIAFSLQRKYSRFSCRVGLDATTKDNVGVFYSLLADGREIYRSPKLKSDADPLPIDVSVTGVKELVLCVDPTEFQGIWSNTDWVDLKFEQ